MQTNPIKRPWIKESKYGSRIRRDPHYQSTSWKKTRLSFREGFTIVNGFSLSNKYCIECYKQNKRLVSALNTDHIVRRKEGGTDDHSNLQTLCDSHHNTKSAREGNELRRTK